MDKDIILEELKKNKEYFKKQFNINEIALFGSFARGEESQDSDVDILIKPDLKDFKNRYFLKEFLEDLFSREVNVLYFDSLRKFVKKEIEGDLIYA